MKNWAVQDAKAHFSEFLDACVDNGPQMVTRRGIETAVLITVAEWKHLQNEAGPSLKTLLLSDNNRFDLEIPPRGSAKRRPIFPDNGAN